MNPVRVIVWNEFRHEKSEEEVKKIYPDGMHTVIAEALNRTDDIKAVTATLDEPQHGLADNTLENTDVLIWWGHIAHDQVNDEVVERVRKQVLAGMGLIVLHSGHYSKIFRSLLGTSCSLKWRDAGEKERLWNLEPSHPITKGIGEYIELPHTEMYGERFDIPDPDKLIFVGWFAGGEVFRSGCTWQRGHGKIFYFQPGHEAYPVFHDPQIIKVITNAVRWARPAIRKEIDCRRVEPLEKL